MFCAVRFRLQLIRTDVDQTGPMLARVPTLEVELERVSRALAHMHQQVIGPRQIAAPNLLAERMSLGSQFLKCIAA